MEFKGLAFRLLFLCLSLLAASDKLFAAEKLKIVTTTSTFASIVKSVVGDKGEVYFVASPKRDVHFISPTPKDVLKLKTADVFIHGGLDLEAWRAPLVDAAGRHDFMNSNKAIDVSRRITLIEVPTSLSRAQGDIHIFGNPHYWLDPLNGKMIVENIAQGLAKLYPKDAAFFMRNAEEFENRIDEKTKAWKNELAPYAGSPVVVYHQSWPYFTRGFGLDVIGDLEPKPGIPPTAKHLEQLIQLMRKRNTKVIVKEVFHESRTPERVAKRAGATVLTLFSQVGESEEAPDYFSMFDYNIRLLKSVLKETAGKTHE